MHKNKLVVKFKGVRFMYVFMCVSTLYMNHYIQEGIT